MKHTHYSSTHSRRSQRGDYTAHPRLHRSRLSRGLIGDVEPKMSEEEEEGDRMAAMRALVLSLNSVPVCVI